MTNEERKVAQTALKVIMENISHKVCYCGDNSEQLDSQVRAAIGLQTMLLDDKEAAHANLVKLEENAAEPNGTQWINSDELAALQNVVFTARDFYNSYQNGYKPNPKTLGNAIKKLDACFS